MNGKKGVYREIGLKYKDTYHFGKKISYSMFMTLNRPVSGEVEGKGRSGVG